MGGVGKQLLVQILFQKPTTEARRFTRTPSLWAGIHKLRTSCCEKENRNTLICYQRNHKNTAKYFRTASLVNSSVFLILCSTAQASTIFVRLKKGQLERLEKAGKDRGVDSLASCSATQAFSICKSVREGLGSGEIRRMSDI